MEDFEEKTDKSTAPVAAIDGGKIKNFRESKKLTQLYVASIVGVTTDTISRWENNRYPCIKRDNADKLAAALEVPLADILKQEMPPPDKPEAPAPLPRRRWLPMLALIILIVAGAAVLFWQRRSDDGLTIVRRLPHFSPPGEITPVQLIVNDTNNTERGLIIKETLPAGWRLINAQPAASISRGTPEEIKWLLPPGSGRRVISYTVRSPRNTPLDATVTFKGQLVLQSDGQSRRIAIDGNRQLKIAGIHWADSNGDSKIDDNEIMPAYYLTEEMKGLGLDWKTIETIWSSSGYRWDTNAHDFIVNR